MNVTEEEASVRSRESVESAVNETQIRRTACAWTRSERAFQGKQDRFHEGVVTQSMEGDGMELLWRAMSVIEGGQGTSAEAKEVQEKIVTAVQERLQAGEMQQPLPRGGTGWQEYVQKLVQGRRMGGPPEVEAWAVKSGYRVKVYRETKDGEGYRKIQEYGGEKGVHVGILWRKTRVDEVVWEHDEPEKGSTAREAEREGSGGGDEQDWLNMWDAREGRRGKTKETKNKKKTPQRLREKCGTKRAGGGGAGRSKRTDERPRVAQKKTQKKENNKKQQRTIPTATGEKVGEMHG